MATHQVIAVIIGAFTSGFIFGRLNMSWKFYKKTGTHIEDYLDNFK